MEGILKTRTKCAQKLSFDGTHIPGQQQRRGKSVCTLHNIYVVRTYYIMFSISSTTVRYTYP